MRLAVTGATGFLGRAFVEQALRRGHTVRALVRPRSARLDALSSAVEVVAGDVRDDPTPYAAALFDRVEVFVMLAAAGVQASGRVWESLIAVNTQAPPRWLRCARDAGVGHAVVAGSCLEYEGHGTLPNSPLADDARPLCDLAAPLQSTEPYGTSKAAGALVAMACARAASLPLWYLRLASLYGRDDDPSKLVPALIAARSQATPFAMTDGAQVREWLAQDDAVRALLVAAESPPPRPVCLVNVGTGVGVALRDVAATLLGDRSRLRLGGLPYRAATPHHLVMDVRSQKELLGFVPASSWHEGMRTLVAAADASPPAMRAQRRAG